MKKIILTLGIVATVIACDNKGTDAVDTKTSKVEGSEDFSYAMGMSMGQRIKMDRERAQAKDSIDTDEIKKGIEAYIEDPKGSSQYLIGLNYGAQLEKMKESNKALNDVLVDDELIEGMTDYLGKKDLRISEDTLSTYMSTYFDGRLKRLGEQNLKDEEAYFAEKANEKDLIKTENGVYIKTNVEGTGESPSIGDEVEVYYTGKTIDGKVFDSTDKTGSTVKFKLQKGQLIAGWIESMTQMKKGGKYTVYIPSKMAYGEAGNRGIAPNETLIFDIELVDFSKANDTSKSGPTPEVKIRAKN